MNDAESIVSIIVHHMKVSSLFYDEELINKIYNDYLDNYPYEENNSTLRILQALKSLVPKKYLNKYEIIDDNNNIRNLEEIKENEKYYGLKLISNRKDVFQTNFLGLDIALALANKYQPSTGQSYNYFKINIGDY